MKGNFFPLENSERFILYCICGCLVGITIILIAIILLLYIEKHWKMDDKRKEMEYEEASAYLPVYRYDGRTYPTFNRV